MRTKYMASCKPGFDGNELVTFLITNTSGAVLKVKASSHAENIELKPNDQYLYTVHVKRSEEDRFKNLHKNIKYDKNKKLPLKDRRALR